MHPRLTFITIFLCSQWRFYVTTCSLKKKTSTKKGYNYQFLHLACSLTNLDNTNHQKPDKIRKSKQFPFRKWPGEVSTTKTDWAINFVTRWPRYWHQNLDAVIYAVAVTPKCIFLIWLSTYSTCWLSMVKIIVSRRNSLMLMIYNET